MHGGRVEVAAAVPCVGKNGQRKTSGENTIGQELRLKDGHGGGEEEMSPDTVTRPWTWNDEHYSIPYHSSQLAVTHDATSAAAMRHISCAFLGSIASIRCCQHRILGSFLLGLGYLPTVDEASS